MTSKKEILSQLEKLNYIKGRPVMVHTSMKAIGEIEAGAKGLLDCLIEYFCERDGILCVPTHTWAIKDEEGYTKLDLNKNETCIGVFPTVASGDERGIRTLNPTHSVAVFAKSREKALDFIKNEEKSVIPTSPCGVYGNMFKKNGYVLLLGVGQNKNTCLHCVEEMLGVKRMTDEPTEKTVTITKDNKKVYRTIYTFDESVIEDVSVFFPKFEKPFRYCGAIEDAVIGVGKAQFCDCVKMKEMMERIYQRKGDIEILADNKELEEKLYK